jgi:gluconolactonase
MRSSDTAILALLLLAVAGGGDVSAQGLPAGIFPAGASVEKLFEGGQFTEGAAVAPDGRVFFSDLPFLDASTGGAGHLWCYDPRTRETRIYRSPSGMSNGLEFDSLGRMLCLEMETGRLVRTDLGSGRSQVLVAACDGRPFNALNDLVLDRRGNVYLTDPYYGEKRDLPQPVTGVYRIDPSGACALIIGDLPNPNGIAISPDGTRLYVGCYDEGEGGRKAMRIVEYAIAPGGTVEFLKVFAEYGMRDGPDGMATDRDGNLYVAVRDESRPGIAVYDPAGREVAFLPVPEIPSNVAFDRSTERPLLYITAGRSLYRVEVLRSGRVPWTTQPRKERPRP